MTDKNPISLRYRDKGNVHMDFHGATNTTINFIIEKYGIETMNDIFKKVGNDVYADIKSHIKSGNIKVLAEHWQHFFDREGADFSISIKVIASLAISSCPLMPNSSEPTLKRTSD